VISLSGQVLPPPIVCSWLPLIFLLALPVGLVLVVPTIINVIICYKVYHQQMTARKWSAKQNMKLTRRVMWQSIWYMLAFCATFPFLLLAFFWNYSSSDDYRIFVLNAFFGPSQGLLNALVYFQRSSGKEFKDLLLVRHATRLQRSMREMTSSSRAPLSILRSPFNPTLSRPASSRLVSAAGEEGIPGNNTDKDNDCIDDNQSDGGSHQGETAVNFQFLDGEEDMADNNMTDGQAMTTSMDTSGNNYCTPDTASSNVDSLEDMFAATREHWQLNFMDNLDSQSSGIVDNNQNSHPERRNSIQLSTHVQA